MRGRHHLIIQSRYLKYEFDLVRNITVIQGNSATGKTTLVDMIREFERNGSDAGITISCDRPCHVLEGQNWQADLQRMQQSIVFVDEGNRFLISQDFAEAVRASDNYYVLVARENLYNLPYSVNEVYGIRSSGKYGSLQPVYHELYPLFTEGEIHPIRGGQVITEDSNSGYEFYTHLYRNAPVTCVGAGGKDKIFDLLQEVPKDQDVLVVADGAAFGAVMGRIHATLRRKQNIQLFLPESFEWILLRSDILKDREVREILESPEEYIDSEQFFSWERFFTDLLRKKSAGTYLHYEKKQLNPAYLGEGNFAAIMRVLPGEMTE